MGNLSGKLHRNKGADLGVSEMWQWQIQDKAREELIPDR